jgi:hypothetical protein
MASFTVKEIEENGWLIATKALGIFTRTFSFYNTQRIKLLGEHLKILHTSCCVLSSTK